MRHLESPDTAFLSYVSIYFIEGWETFDFVQEHELFLKGTKICFAETPLTPTTPQSEMT